jgi:ABC-type bacteriocin/lantibiotic exporter with double-glycine peptidase domain
MTIGTMLFGILQVKDGTFALGFLLLIKWSFDELWQILVYAIEYYVSLIQQRADATLLRDSLAPGGLDAHHDATVQLNDWTTITLTDASIAFPATAARNAVSLNVPEVTVHRQDWVGVIGPSGAGKTTLLLMIANLLPHKGKLAIDGHPIESGRISPEDLSIVTTSDPLFKLSLRDNLSLGREVTDAHLLRCLEAAGVDFAFSLDSVVGSSDFNLSAGQEQRVRLARGLAHSGSLLLLDEPFTALDRASRTLAQARMKEFLRSRTVVMVTHSAEDLDLVNRVYEVRNGAVMAVNRS